MESIDKVALHILDNFYTFSGSEKTRTFEERRRTLLILVFLIHAAGYMSAYPERSGPHQRVFNCHQAMVLSGRKSVYVVFLRNEKINLKVIILRFLSPGKNVGTTK